MDIDMKFKPLSNLLREIGWRQNIDDEVMLANDGVIVIFEFTAKLE